jgi:hypothetical protein
VDELITRAASQEQLQEAKRVILSHVFTLRKENRHLLRRINGMEQTGNVA